MVETVGGGSGWGGDESRWLGLRCALAGGGRTLGRADTASLIELAPPEEIGGAENGCRIRLRTGGRPPLHQPVHCARLHAGIVGYLQDGLPGEGETGAAAGAGLVGGDFKTSALMPST